MSEEYYATFKYVANGKPVSSGIFMCNDTREALDKMCEIARIQDTTNLHSYDLLKIVGKNYIRVATKVGQDEFPRAVIPSRPEPVRREVVPIATTVDKVSKLLEDCDSYKSRSVVTL